MNKEQQLKEEYCKMNGWEKVKGYKISEISAMSDYDEFFVSYENAEDYITKDVEFWQDKEGNYENIFEDIDELIDEIEGWDNAVSFEDWKKRKKEVQNAKG